MTNMEFGTVGSWIDGAERTTGATFEILNPATEAAIGEVAVATPDDVEAAIAAADAAADAWADFDPVERSQLLGRFADRIRETVSRLARTETLEMGRSLGASEAQAGKTAQYFDYYGGIADKIEGETIPIHGDGDVLDYTIREPYGVTAHVVPWNAALVLTARSVAPALAAGNTVVAKAPERAPLSMLTLAEIATEAGIPDGVFNVVTGGEARTGRQLTDDDRVAHIEFTGSTETGREVMKTAADHITPVHLELGGKSPNVVFPDADLTRAAADSAKAFWNTGQTCFAPTRIFVHEDVSEPFTDMLVEAVEEMDVGPGIDGNTIGPLIDAAALDRVESFVESALADGATLLTGGARLDRDGYFYEPTVLANVADDAPVSCTEIFGPVVTVSEFGSESEAVSRANDTEYGLYGLVWTTDVSRAHRMARKLEAGTVLINEYLFASQQAPSGGYKKSGIGRAKGQQALENYTQTKNVVVSITDE
ncbi:aldehyde dehydrogenase family protein [Halorientalis pallida]|uniref:Aldehyde dehydrogenase n=1 Tax=Halorientalis pallida TaxID=2479928 RepID=A0A498L2G8_9EURY|nr:aldehyde dehydrogenase family protein [Halorientalis pallida]RXK47961.1 aldehyde dehydrogenase [Halorientalis pallida]